MPVFQIRSRPGRDFVMGDIQNVIHTAWFFYYYIYIYLKRCPFQGILENLTVKIKQELVQMFDPSPEFFLGLGSSLIRDDYLSVEGREREREAAGWRSDRSE